MKNTNGILVLDLKLHPYQVKTASHVNPGLVKTYISVLGNESLLMCSEEWNLHSSQILIIIIMLNDQTQCTLTVLTW